MKTYGTYALSEDGSYWEINCTPHAAVRFKRVFERVGKNAGTIRLAATPENAKELVWFMGAFPLAPKRPTDKKKLTVGKSDHDRMLAKVEAILAPSYVAKPVKLAEPARPYQQLPAEMALALGGNAGVLCCDSVGLGKTLEAIILMCNQEARPALVVTLNGNLPTQWVREMNRFAPHLTHHIVNVGSPSRMGKPQDLAAKLERGEATPDVIIISYSKIAGWADYLAPIIKSVIYDEAQEFRTGAGTARFSAGRVLSNGATYRLGLSATPIYNRGFEMFNVMQVVAPGQLGTEEEFAREWGGSMVSNPIALGSALRERGVFIRRTPADVGRQLPRVQILEQYVDCDSKPFDDVDSRATELARFLLQGGGRGDAMRASEELSFRLRQATGFAKAPFVADFVRLLIESGEPVVLFGWHHGVYEIWAEMLADFKPAFYHGEISIPQKREAQRRFEAGETDLMIMSLRAGAGIDGLQKRARYSVFGELDWSPGKHIQCIGRLNRDGQVHESGVTAIFCVTDEGSDPGMVDALGLKKQQLDGILDGVVIETEEILGGHDIGRAKTLARNFLAQRGLSEPVKDVSIPEFDFTQTLSA